MTRARITRRHTRLSDVIRDSLAVGAIRISERRGIRKTRFGKNGIIIRARVLTAGHEFSNVGLPPTV